jgi:hypothetical protein
MEEEEGRSGFDEGGVQIESFNLMGESEEW